MHLTPYRDGLAWTHGPSLSWEIVPVMVNKPMTGMSPVAVISPMWEIEPVTKITFTNWLN